LTDENGGVKTTYSYDPFGNVTITGEASDNPFQYTGRENDGTGLYYYRFRYYSSELQRFISEDPIRLFGGFNFYRYVENNPVNFVDPLGLQTQCSQSQCNQSWAQCYANCINTLAPGFGTIFIGTNIVGSASFSAADKVLITIGSGKIPPPMGLQYLFTSLSSRALFQSIALSIGRVSFTVQAVYTAWTAGASYGCMISCAMNSCNY
jgi:RHS repeat-associated protein